jgi:hypothetical protein
MPMYVCMYIYKLMTPQRLSQDALKYHEPPIVAEHIPGNFTYRYL